jgi:hypothetical protein
MPHDECEITEQLAGFAELWDEDHVGEGEPYVADVRPFSDADVLTAMAPNTKSR